MKPHEPKKYKDKTRAKKNGETKGDNKPTRKRRKGNKTLSQKSEKGWEKLDKKEIKRKKTKDQDSGTLASTLSYLMLAPW
jgi:hypothetical protein